MAKKYGQIHTFYQLNIVNVMINNAKIVRQILTKLYAQDRDSTSTVKPAD